MSKEIVSCTNGDSNRFPSFILTHVNADPNFVGLIERKLRAIDFSDPRFCDDFHRAFYLAFKRDGFEVAIRSLILESGLTADHAVALARSLQHHVGCHLIAGLTREEKARYLPHNDVIVRPAGMAFEVQFSSLQRATSNGCSFFHSKRKPTVTFDGSSYIVGFSKHVIKQICSSRLVPNYLDYLGLGDAHSYFADCIYFEPTYVRRDGENASHEFSQEAIGLIQNCHLNSIVPGIFDFKSELCMQIVADDPTVNWLFQPCYLRVGYPPSAFATALRS